MTGRGVGPTPPTRPTNPADGPPKPGRALEDPATLASLNSVWRRAMERAGLTIADLRAPQDEHVRAA